MPEVILRPAAVSLFASGGSSPHPESVVVGSPPQWADNSDATYSTTHRRATANLNGSDNAGALLDVYLGPTPLSVTVTIRASCSPWGGASNRVFALIGYPDGRLGGEGSDFHVIADGAIHTLDAVPVYDLAAVTEVLMAGPALLSAAVYSPATADVTIYEAWVTVTYGGLPPRRIFPRDDGRAGSSTPRTYPASKAHQQGNRLGGGYL